MKSQIIGLTGNICSGKTTVARILKERGATVLNRDDFLYEAYKLPSCKSDLVDCIGGAILGSDGEIDRTKLKIFLKQHPHLCFKVWNITDKYVDPRVLDALQNINSLTFFECSSLYEKDLDHFCRYVVMCYAPDDVRALRLITRARERDGFVLTEDEARAVFIQQTISQGGKMGRPDFVIRNDGTFDDLTNQTLSLYQRILEMIAHESTC